MPLGAFIAALESNAGGGLVGVARPFRDNPGPNEHAFVTPSNSQMAAMFGR